MTEFHFDNTSDTKGTGREKHPQGFRKLWIWPFGEGVHQMKSSEEVLKLTQNFQKNEIVTGKIQFFEMVPFFTPHSICLYIGLWEGSFLWKRFSFFRKFVLKLSIENVQTFQWLSHKDIPIFQTEGYFENPKYCFSKEHFQSSFCWL